MRGIPPLSVLFIERYRYPHSSLPLYNFRVSVTLEGTGTEGEFSVQRNVIQHHIDHHSGLKGTSSSCICFVYGKND